MAQVTHNSNVLTPPAWAGDYFNREHLIPGGAHVDPAQFLAEDAVVVTANGNAAAAATSVTVQSLSGPIPDGTLLYFGAGKFARLTAAAAAAATTLAVEALVAQIDDGDQATYAGTRKKVVPSGTAVGRTFAERAAGDAFGPAASGDDELFLIAFDLPDADQSPDIVLYRPGSVVKENFLPGWSSLSAAVQALIRATYATTIGQE